MMAPVIPTNVMIFCVMPVATAASARSKMRSLRSRSEAMGDIRVWADTDGAARIIILALSHDRLISSVRTRPRMSERYAGLKDVASSATVKQNKKSEIQRKSVTS